MENLLVALLPPCLDDADDVLASFVWLVLACSERVAQRMPGCNTPYGLVEAVAVVQRCLAQPMAVWREATVAHIIAQNKWRWRLF